MNIQSLALTVLLVNICCPALMCTQSTPKNPIAIYTFYTPSHTELVENWFLPSLAATQNNDYTLILEYHEQECASGAYMDAGWTKSMLRKVELILRAIDECWGDMFVYADIDIQFFRPIKKLVTQALKDKDFVAQQDNPQGGICAGFFASRANAKTKQLWQTIKQMMIENPGKSDQPCLNEVLRLNPINELAWGYLPETFFGAGTLQGMYWNPGDQLEVPEGIVLHHANYTKGIENKIQQLEYIKHNVEAHKR